MTKPLEGVKVVEVAEQSFVPSAAAALADWGADVVKIERPQGDPLRAVTASGLVTATEGFDYLTENANRNKRGLCLDLKTRTGARYSTVSSARRTSSSRTSYPTRARSCASVPVISGP